MISRIRRYLLTLECLIQLTALIPCFCCLMLFSLINGNGFVSLAFQCFHDPCELENCIIQSSGSGAGTLMYVRMS